MSAESEQGYAFYCDCSRLVDLRKKKFTFCIGCGVFYHRWHNLSNGVSGYVPPPSKETCLCEECNPAQQELFVPSP